MYFFLFVFKFKINVGDEYRRIILSWVYNFFVGNKNMF